MKTSIFTLYYSIECYTVGIPKPLAWLSTVDPSGHFDYSYACAPQQKNPDSVKK